MFYLFPCVRLFSPGQIGIAYYCYDVPFKSIHKYIQRVRNGCRGLIADMTVHEALRVDTDGGIKPDMTFLTLLCECKQGMLPYFNSFAAATFVSSFFCLSAPVHI
jgi:hypothetical protein